MANKRTRQQGNLDLEEDPVTGDGKQSMASVQELMQLIQLQTQADIERRRLDREAAVERQEREKAGRDRQEMVLQELQLQREIDRERQDRQRQLELDNQTRERANDGEMMHRQIQETVKECTKSQVKIALPKLEPIKGGEFIDVELSRFERVMRTHEIPQERWMAHLSPLLGGDALVAMDNLAGDTAVYDEVKAAILAHLGVTQDFLV
jgi:hypothetical protein